MTFDHWKTTEPADERDERPEACTDPTSCGAAALCAACRELEVNGEQAALAVATLRLEVPDRDVEF
jgi:hypothetical protein